MLMDQHATFAEGEAIGASTGRRIVGDVYDLENIRDIGSSDNVWLVVQVATTFTSGGAGTLQLEFVSDAQAALATDGTATEHIVSPEFALADLTAGTVLIRQALPLETSGAPYERYIGLLANVGTAAMTAGTLTAFLTQNPPSVKLYPNNVQ